MFKMNFFREFNTRKRLSEESKLLVLTGFEPIINKATFYELLNILKLNWLPFIFPNEINKFIEGSVME